MATKSATSPAKKRASTSRSRKSASGAAPLPPPPIAPPPACHRCMHCRAIPMTPSVIVAVLGLMVLGLSLLLVDASQLL